MVHRAELAADSLQQAVETLEVGGALRLRLEAKTTPGRSFLFLPQTSNL